MDGQCERDFGEAALMARPELRGHLARESFIALAKRPWREQVVDRTIGRRTMRAGFLLALAWGLSKQVRGWTECKRVGIVFPPGLGGCLANLAVVLAGKVPVNLNFTLGPAAARSCMERAAFDCVLSAKQVRDKLPDFPWPETGVVDLVESIKGLPKTRTLAFLAALYLSPAAWLASLLRVPRRGDREEAALLFTSGSSGEPKGVVLSHRNILGNCLQIDQTGLLTGEERMIANLPIFHSFGFTVTLWYPLLRGCRLVTVPSPLEVGKTAEAVEAEAATVLTGTPTFLRPYLKKARPSQLASLKFVIAGAEKTPEGFAALWEERFDCRYLEGYGLTETAPVVSVNTIAQDDSGAAVGRRVGSVGRPLCGQRLRFLDPETRAALPPNETGLLAVKGPNVFERYLGDAERTAAAKDGDWFVTGDLARLDADGFLFIEGRLSRFSKVGGEMVSHHAVEAALAAAYGLDSSEAPQLAVVGQPDAAKGERLVLLTTVPIDASDLREKLLAAGFANLWIPKEVKVVSAIPVLASGKLDLQGLRDLAAAAPGD